MLQTEIPGPRSRRSSIAWSIPHLSRLTLPEEREDQGPPSRLASRGKVYMSGCAEALTQFTGLRTANPWTPRFAAAPGHHDDLLIATALAVWWLQSQRGAGGVARIVFG